MAGDPAAIRPTLLRLVHPPSQGRSVPDRRAEVGRENRLAAGAAIGPGDARHELVLEAARAIEGGRAAILRPEARQRLVARAGAMGVRAFDAHLIIAIAQDAARRGEDPTAAPSLPMVGAGRGASAWWLWVVAGVMGLVMFGALVGWVAGV